MCRINCGCVSSQLAGSGVVRRMGSLINTGELVNIVFLKADCLLLFTACGGFTDVSQPSCEM